MHHWSEGNAFNPHDDRAVSLRKALCHDFSLPFRMLSGMLKLGNSEASLYNNCYVSSATVALS